MRRSVWIFLASIFLPSLGLAWMAARSAQDQEVLLEHQQVIITQNITDSLAQNIQAQMDQVRADFVSTTQRLLAASASPQILAEDFNGKLHDAWPMAEIGFAVNLDGEIYSPKPFDGPNARTFRTENDQFLSNRENAEIYSSNLGGLTQNFRSAQNAFSLKGQASPPNFDVNAAAPAGQSGASQQNTSDQQAAYLEKFTETARALKVAANQNAAQSPAPESPPRQSVSSGEAATLEASTVVTAPTAAAAERQEKNQKLQNEVGPPVADTSATSPAGTAEAAPEQDKLLSQPSSANEDVDSGAMVTAQLKEEMATRDRNTPVANMNLHAAAPPASTVVVNARPAPAPDESVVTAAPPPTSTPVGGSFDLAGSTTPATNGLPEADSLTLNAQIATKIPRRVIPQKMLTNASQALSNTVPEESDFRRVIGSETSGALARFLENKLRLMVWSHPSDTPIVFGAQLDISRLADSLQAAFPIPEAQPDSFSRSRGSEYCLAILDDTGQPVALSQAGFRGDWKHPFVATEIGEALPHWEAALYLVDPQQISRTARTLRFTLGLIVLVLVAAIVSGGSLIAADVRRQMRLAQQKTDFVSNVSHELKTPLTSIRMFADLLAQKRVPDEQRQSTYLRIISAEAARLTRLINNVLDFARLERGAPPGEHRDCDLVDAVRDVVETCAPHLEAAGIAFRHEIEADALPIRGDRDALAQIILNLVSNAEKYGGSDILVRVRQQETPAGALGCVDVLDRGPGIPAAKVRTVFEPFHRLDDSLASGVPGSGLGLTLARRMARSHGGDVTYSARAGGGSCFTLTIPLRGA